MSKKVKIRVSRSVWAETDTSWHLLVSVNEENGAASEGHWFPKKLCSLTYPEGVKYGELELPEWLHESKQLKNIKYEL